MADTSAIDRENNPPDTAALENFETAAALAAASRQKVMDTDCPAIYPMDWRYAEILYANAQQMQNTNTQRDTQETTARYLSAAQAMEDLYNKTIILFEDGRQEELAAAREAAARYLAEANREETDLPASTMERLAALSRAQRDESEAAVVASTPPPVVASTPPPVVASTPPPVVASTPPPVVASTPAADESPPSIADAQSPDESEAAAVASAPPPFIASAPAADESAPLIADEQPPDESEAAAVASAPAADESPPLIADEQPPDESEAEAVASAPPGQYPLPSQYTVRPYAISGDTFTNIAARPWVYNNPFLWRRLYEANRSKLPNPNNPHLILPGMVIDIPSIKGEHREGMWQEGRPYPDM